MLIDVGDIRNYIRKRKPTKALLDLCRMLAKSGVAISSFSEYDLEPGDEYAIMVPRAGYIWREGVLYSPMSGVNKPVPGTVGPVKYKEPHYEPPSYK
ncbi:hypothetical protein A3D71_02940 [Candidatus Kaiserbacteria bacterium RIFCSPHIGHO2_02_FULL_55_20]|uniref:Uncharacterized protein n=1 Tax=Candidatus Kaiserbacteria bacterium RIFCSPHIGHO2_02_FULL_55_20 TaxID=1798497 RepID=A0A1F6DW47_9BACT|nr:MAG: hypothetical protein A2680_01315 [Candidatus Kaiserbacteria bacterium RIFCSPHIGHO2_01_FULL_55_37]OGG65644.1 MAG: hypothetical protein A3D71_02940 [Candidatus Kaiserbacteria bacterium RIFCSPHIGHO2_02_FULL_55_20]